MSEHTPGQMWHRHGLDIHVEQKDSAGKVIKHNIIAHVHSPSFLEQPFRDIESNANADLIIAAPEMLEALKLASTELDAIISATTSVDAWVKATNAVRAAIVKATPDKEATP